MLGSSVCFREVDEETGEMEDDDEQVSRLIKVKGLIIYHDIQFHIRWDKYTGQLDYFEI